MANRLQRVRDILNAAADQLFPGGPIHDGKGRFWNLPPDEFVNAEVYGFRVIEVGQPENSAMIRALKGEAPFDGGLATVRTAEGEERTVSLVQMPAGGRDPVRPADIAFIEEWIRDGCPDDEDES